MSLQGRFSYRWVAVGTLAVTLFFTVRLANRKARKPSYNIGEEPAQFTFLGRLANLFQSFTGLVPSNSAPSTPARSRALSKSHECFEPTTPRKVSCPIGVIIVYCTTTGTAEIFSRKAEESLQRQHVGGDKDAPFLMTSVEDCHDVTLADLLKKDLSRTIVAFLVATHGEGDPPESARKLFRDLRKCERGSLQNNLPLVAVFGLGNRSYEVFNGAARKLVRLLRRAGAAFACRYGEGDDSDDIDEDFDYWLNEVLTPAALGQIPHDHSESRRVIGEKDNSPSGNISSRHPGRRKSTHSIDLPGDHTGDSWRQSGNIDFERLVEGVSIVPSLNVVKVQELNVSQNADGAIARTFFELENFAVCSRDELFDASLSGRLSTFRLTLKPANIPASSSKQAQDCQQTHDCVPLEHSAIVPPVTPDIPASPISSTLSVDSPISAVEVDILEHVPSVLAPQVILKESSGTILERYEAGDSIDILPMQPDSLVEFFFERIVCDPTTGKKSAAVMDITLDHRLLFAETEDGAAAKGVHFPFPNGCSLKTLLAAYTDLKSTPKKDVLRKLIFFIKGGPDREQALQKIEQLSRSSDAIDHLFQPHAPGKRFLTFADIILFYFEKAHFAATRKDFIAALLLLPRNIPRSYSIDTCPEETARTGTVGLTVSLSTATRPPFKSEVINRVSEQYARSQNTVCSAALDLVRETFNTGLCSGYLGAGKKAPCHVLCRLSPSKIMRLRNGPVLFIATGSGIAPIRAFLKQIQLRAQSANLTGLHLDDRVAWNLPSRVAVFYGCRAESLCPHKQFLEEMSLSITVNDQKVQPPIISDLHFAFSRAGTERRYVQDLLFVERWLVSDIADNGGSIYLCGSTKMAFAVRGALQSLLGADVYVSMKQEKRLIEEAWD